MDLTLMEIIWTMKSTQDIIVFDKGRNATGLISVRDIIEQDYKGFGYRYVDFIQPEKCGGLLGYKEVKYIEIYLK